MISAMDENNEPRAMELSNHPFFIGVGFQPERSGLKGEVHPLGDGFCENGFPGKLRINLCRY